MLFRSGINGAFIRDLAEIPAGNWSITALDFTGTLIEPEQLERIAALDKLEELLLPAYMWNEGAGSKRDSNDLLKNLAALKSLKRLHTSIHFLTNMEIRDKGLDQIAALTQLEDLRLAQSKIKGSGLKHFVNLRSLDVRYSAVNDAGMESLRGMTRLSRRMRRSSLVDRRAHV